MKHTPQSKVDKKKRLCVSPVIKSVTIISDTQILSYRFNLCVVTYQYKVSLFLLEFTCNLMLFGEKSNSLICPQIVFFSECIFVNIALYFKKSLLRDWERISYVCCKLIVPLYKPPYYWESPTERGEKKRYCQQMINLNREIYV